MGTPDQVQGIEVTQLNEVKPALQKATQNQKNGLITLIELHLTIEPTAIFRADAMKKPYRFLNKYSHLSTGEKPS